VRADRPVSAGWGTCPGRAWLRGLRRCSPRRRRRAGAARGHAELRRKCFFAGRLCRFLRATDGDGVCRDSNRDGAVHFHGKPPQRLGDQVGGRPAPAGV